MTPDEIDDWQCKMHLWSCYLYEVEDAPALSDTDYDELCRYLLRIYDRLPDWYRQRVSKGDLTSGSGAAIARSLTPDEIAAARWWRDEHIPAMRKEMDERHRRLLAERVPARTTGRRTRRTKGAQANREGAAEGARG